MSNRQNRPRLGDILVQRGLITKEVLNKALAMHKRTGDPLGRIMIAQGFIRRQSLYKVCSNLESRSRRHETRPCRQPVRDG